MKQKLNLLFEVTRGINNSTRGKLKLFDPIQIQIIVRFLKTDICSIISINVAFFMSEFKN